jgi:hypothetical protein
MAYVIEMRDVKGAYELVHEYDREGRYIGSFVQKFENGKFDRVRLSVLELSRLGVSVNMENSIKQVFEKIKDDHVSS